MQYPHRSEGFTLIELSIVLVIVGLLVAGVMVGRDLIKGAEIRAQISQIEKFKTAAATFRAKYNCIPGDCPNAEAAGLGQSAGPGANGNGDGRIYATGVTFPLLVWGEAKESINFWYHLTQAGLINHPSTGWLNAYEIADNSAILIPIMTSLAPPAVIGNYGGAKAVILPYTYDSIANNPAQDIMAGNSFAFASVSSSLAVTGYPLSLDEAYGIDSKIDDGNSCTGIVVTSYSEIRMRAACLGDLSGRYIAAFAPYGLVIEKAW